MYRYISILSIAVLLVTAGCAKVETLDCSVVDDAVISEAPSVDNESAYTPGSDKFSACIDNSSDENGESKTVLSQDSVSKLYEIAWNKGDAVTLMATSLSDDEFSTAYFDYSTPEGDGEFGNVAAPVDDWSKIYKVTAFYPASSFFSENDDKDANDPELKKVYGYLPPVQKYEEGSFGNGAYPMVATCYGPTSKAVPSVFPFFSFKATCGIFRLRLRSEENISVASVALIAPNKGISGKFEYSDGIYKYAGDGSKEDNTVTLVCGESNGNGIQLSGDEEKIFTFVLPPAEYDSFKIAIRTTDNKYREFSLKTGKSICILRSRVQDLSLNAIGFKCKYEVVKEETLSYSYVEEHMFDKAPEMTNLYKSYFLVGQIGLSAFSITDYPDSKTNVSYKSIVLNYATVDARGREVWASGRVYLNYNTKNKAYVDPTHIILGSHYTIGATSEAPSVFNTFDMGLALQGGLVVAPDYVGYGCSGDVDHPYLARDLTAINALDMVRAAKAYMASQGVNVSNSLKLYNLGYSQGGGSALAIGRYIEKNNLLSEFKLTKTCCGAGVYSPEYFWNSMEESGSCSYPGGIPLMVMGMKCAYPDLLTAPLEKYFSDKVNKGGVVDAIRSKQYTVDGIAEVLATAVGKKASDPIYVTEILSAEALDSSNDLYKQIHAALKKNEVLTDDWTSLGTKYYFLHYIDDEIVPYHMMEMAKSHFGNTNATYDTFEGASGIISALSSNAKNLECHRGTAGLFYARCWGGLYKN